LNSLLNTEPALRGTKNLFYAGMKTIEVTHKGVTIKINQDLDRHSDAAGFVVPKKYTEGRRLDDITKRIAHDSK